MSIKTIPGVNSGRPIIAGRGVPVWVIKSRHAAGDSIEFLADDFEITVDEVQEALAFEIPEGRL